MRFFRFVTNDTWPDGRLRRGSPEGVDAGEEGEAVGETDGEAMSYFYDSLNRLVKAEQTAGPGVTLPPNPIMWCYDHIYDGFGNRWNQTIISGKAGIPSKVQFNQNLDRIFGQSYDANGNMTGD